jgi:hypothetical protein
MESNRSADVIITMVGGYGLGVASRFARSLRETGAPCRLVMLLPSQPASFELAAALTEWRVEPWYYKSGKGSASAYKLVRYREALRFLQRERINLRGAHVMLADSRDVIFQRNPFTIPVDVSRPLAVFLEDYFRTFANSGINQGHVRPCFGNVAVQRTFLTPPRPVSCSGVTLGTYEAISQYLQLMSREMSKPQYNSTCLKHDQAFHNWLLWTGQLSPVQAWSNEDGPVTTIGWPEHLYRDRYGRVLNRRGELVHVVHQYDRRKRLMASLGRRYDLVSKPEPAPRDPAPTDTASAFTQSGWPQGIPIRATRGSSRTRR